MPSPDFQAKVALNGLILDSSAVRISPLGEGFMHGRGLFETIKVLRGRPVFHGDHAARLLHSAAALGIAYAPPPAELLERCIAVITANGLGVGSLKIVVFQDVESVGELILARPDSYPRESHARGFKLKTFPDARRDGDLSGHKTLNYLKNGAARAQAKADGFDEALFVDPAGAVLEGAASNVFMVSGGIVHTPPLSAGILPGIARARILGLLGPSLSRERRITLAEILEAEEVFVTNALVGVMPVVRIDLRTFDATANPATRGLAEALRREMTANIEAK